MPQPHGSQLCSVSLLSRLLPVMTGEESKAQRRSSEQ